VPIDDVNGTPLFYETAGHGEPLVLVHGGWGDTEAWAFVVPGLAESFQVVTYDRRGHGQSGGAPEAGTVHDDVADLAALIEKLGIAPAHLAANSYGACISLRLTIERPDLVHRISVHEPPLTGLLAEDPVAASVFDEYSESLRVVQQLLEAGDHAGGAERFVETIAGGPGTWSQVPPPMHEKFVRHAPTALGELRDADAFTIDVEALRRVSTPVQLTQGDQSPPIFAPVIDRLARLLPSADRHTFTGAGHAPQMNHPRDYVAVVTRFLQST
jgi:pimeloyl-ACP methyl ester carboxylesterase